MGVPPFSNLAAGFVRPGGRPELHAMTAVVAHHVAAHVVTAHHVVAAMVAHHVTAHVAVAIM